MEINYTIVKNLLKEKKYDEVESYMHSQGAVTIPKGLAGNIEETKRTIKILKFLLKLQEAMKTGKYVYSDEKGLKKEIKTHFLGYLEISRD